MKKIKFELTIIITMAVCVIITMLVSCEKEFKTEEATAAKPSTELIEVAALSKIGIPGQSPDLIIEELSYDYSDNGWSNGYGVRYTGTNFGVRTNSDGSKVLQYNCPIGNIAPQVASNKNDFVADMSEDGIVTGSGGYAFKGFLYRALFQNGLPVDVPVKEIFYTQSTDFRNGYNFNLHRDYDYDTMYIGAQAADLYANKVILQQNADGSVKDGKYLLVIEINPDKLIYETNYNNNVATLPFTIQGGVASVDLSVINENHTQPATNLIGHYEGRNVKKVFLDWDCPYHLPVYVKHWFTIKKNGVVIADNVINSDYADAVSGNFKSAVYEVSINVPGLGQSVFNSIIITK